MSTTQNPLNPEYTQDGEKRLRTKVACDYCRKRKSKCDGEQPCSKCISRKRQCVYSYVSKERKKREGSGVFEIQKPQRRELKLSRQGKTIQELNTRINVLENLITKLVSTLDPSDKMGILSQLSGNHDLAIEVESDTRISDERSQDEDLEEGSNGGSPLKEKSLVADATSMKQMLAPPSNAQRKECIAANTIKRISDFCGAHSLMNTISGRSLKWVKERMQGSQNSPVEKQIYAPLKSVTLLLSDAVDRSTNMLSRQTQLRNFASYFDPQHKDLYLEILDAYYRRACIGAFVCPMIEIQNLFDKYYYAISTNNHFILSSITRSEYLIMNTALVLSLSKFTSPKQIIGSHHPNLSTLTIEKAEELRKKFFDNALYDYSYVSKQNEGFKSLQSLALLSLVIEESFISDFHVNYIIVSILVRYAQELGLHHVEVLQEKDKDFGLACRKMWLFCEYMSVEISYKSGKPMLINNADVTTLSELDPCIISVPRDLFVNPDFERNASNVIEALKKEGAVYYFAHFSLILVRIKAKSYYKLYSKLPSNINAQGALTIVNEINDDMKTLALLIEPEVLEPNQDHPFVLSMFDCDPGTLKFHVLLFYLSYFAHMFAVNRVPFLEQLKIEDDRLLIYGNKSLKAARSVLQSVSNQNSLWKVDDASFPFLLFYPFVAFLSLLSNCLQCPSDSSSYYDCLLLIDASLNFFAYNGTQSSNLDNKRMFCDMVSRSILKLLIETMETKANVYFYRMRPGLKEHVDSLQTKYPEIFKYNTETGTNSSALVQTQSETVLSTSSPSTSTGLYNAGRKQNFSSFNGGFQQANRWFGDQQNNFGVGMPSMGESIDIDSMLTEDNFNQFVFGELNELSGFFDNDLNPSLWEGAT